MEDLTDSGYETDGPQSKPVDSVVCDVHEDSDKDDEEPKEKLHVDSFISFPNKLIGRQNTHYTMINGAMINALIDTGSQVSIMSTSMYEEYFNYIPIKPVSQLLNLKGVTGDQLSYRGSVELVWMPGMEIAGVGAKDEVPVEFIVVDEKPGYPMTHGDSFCIIGMNAIETLWLYYRDVAKPCFLNFAYVGLTKAALTEDRCLGRLKLTRTVKIPPKSDAYLKCSLRSKTTGLTAQIRVECDLEGLNNQDMLLDCSLSPYSKVNIPVRNNLDTPVELSEGLFIGSAHFAPAPFRSDHADFNTKPDQDSELNLDEHTLEESNFVKGNHPGLVDEDDEEITPDMQTLYDNVDKYDMSSADKKNLLDVIDRNSNVFSKSEYDIGKVKGVKHSYTLTDDVPFKVRQRNLPPRMYQAARDHLNQLLDRGIIRFSASPYSSAPMFIQKPDGRVRMVTDLRHLNAKTVRDCYALPRFDDILPYLTGSKYFSKMDIRSGYYNIEVEEKDKEKTAFGTVFGLYEYNRMVQGAKTSAATFQRCMENILRPMLYQGAIAFLDDVIIYSKSKEEHYALLDRAFTLMEQAGLKLHPGKCDLMCKEIVYLGHTISQAGVSANSAKTQTLHDWKRLETVKDVLSFLGFCGYFRRHIKHFSQIAKPLQELVKGVHYKPKSKFGPPVRQPALHVSIVDKWTVECQQARDKLIQALTTPPLLIFPDLDKPFILHVDASTTGLGAVLLQFGDDKRLHPVCYASRSLKNAETSYAPHKLEFLALKWAVADKFNFYLYGRQFKVYTDNNPLTYIHKSLKVDATSQRWLAALGEYDFSIHYKPGTTNIDADILSRLHEKSADITVSAHIHDIVADSDVSWINYVDVTELNPTNLGRVNIMTTATQWLEFQLEDDNLNIVRELMKSQNKLKPRDFPLEYRRLFYHRDKLFFDDNDVLMKRAVLDGLEYKLVVLHRAKISYVLNMLHDRSGHQGVDRLCKLFQRRFYYSGYFKFIGDYVQGCPVCLCKKGHNSANSQMGRVHASRPFEVLSMDFLKLDQSKHGYQKVLVVMDVFTKYAFAFPTKNELATTVAKLLVDNIFNVFGIPHKLHSDRGRNFESDVIAQLCNLYGIKKVFTCPYSPQSNALPERFNQTIINMVGTLTEQQRMEWQKHLPHLVTIYNNTPHASTNLTPFELVFGRKSRLPIDVMLGTTPEDKDFPNLRQYIKDLKSRLEVSWQIARDNCYQVHLTNKHRYDEHVRPVFLNIGDRVLVRNVGIRGEHKLEPIWLPQVYEVIRKISDNERVYEVKNISNPKRKNRVLHIDMLKPLSNMVSKYMYTRFQDKKEPHFDLEAHSKQVQELFDKATQGEADNGTVLKADHCRSVDNQGASQKSRYLLRSKGKDTLGSADRLSGSPSESEESEDEVETHSNGRLVETQQAPRQVRHDEDSGDGDAREVDPDDESDDVVSESVDLVGSDHSDSLSDVELVSESSSESLPGSDVEDIQLSVHSGDDHQEAMLPDPTGSPGGVSDEGVIGARFDQDAVGAAAPAREVATAPVGRRNPARATRGNTIDRLGVVPGLKTFVISARPGRVSYLSDGKPGSEFGICNW